MAESILKLKVDSTEYNNKIKRAAEGLQQYAEGCRKAGGTLEHLDDGVLEFTKSLGQMSTTATSAKGKVNEMSKAFTDLSMEYKQLTDAEKQAPFGKALSQSLDQLKTRVQTAKKDLSEINSTLNGSTSTGGGGLFSGDKISGMLQVFGGNLMTKGAGMLMGFASEIGDCIKQGIELAKQGEGIRMAFERLNRPGILDGLREATHGTVTDIELMKAAVQFNDFKLPLEELGTMLAFAQQKAKDTGQSVEYMTNSIVTGLGRKSVMILDNLGISASEVKERMKETGDMTKAVGEIVREQMAKAGEYVETAAERATQADVKLKNAMEDLGRTFEPLTSAGASMWNDLKVGALDLLNNAVRPLIDALTEAGRIRSQYASQGGDVRVNRQLDRLRGINTLQYRRNTYNAQLSNYDSKIGSYEQYLSDYKKWESDKTAVGAYDRMRAFQKQTGLSMYSDVKEQLAVFQKMRAEYVNGAKSIIADNPAPSPATPTVVKPTGGGGGRGGSNVDINALVAGQWEKAMMNGANAGTKAKETTGPSDAFNAYVASVKSGSQEVVDSVGSMTDAFIALNKAQGVTPTNEIANDGKIVKGSFSEAARSVSNLGASLSGLESPGAKIAGVIAQAIANIALAFSNADLKDGETGNVWYWIASTAAGAAAMISTIAAIHSATGYAEGGIIKGNSYSGDNIGGLVDGSHMVGLNAGEIVLNQAQQSNVAHGLQGGAFGGMRLSARLDGKDLLLSIDRTGQTLGYGQLVFFH